MQYCLYVVWLPHYCSARGRNRLIVSVGPGVGVWLVDVLPQSRSGFFTVLLEVQRCQDLPWPSEHAACLDRAYRYQTTSSWLRSSSSDCKALGLTSL